MKQIKFENISCLFFLLLHQEKENGQGIKDSTPGFHTHIRVKSITPLNSTDNEQMWQSAWYVTLSLHSIRESPAEISSKTVSKIPTTIKTRNFLNAVIEFAAQEPFFVKINQTPAVIFVIDLSGKHAKIKIQQQQKKKMLYVAVN